MDKIRKLLELIAKLNEATDDTRKTILGEIDSLRGKIDIEKLDKDSKDTVAESKKYRERAQKAEARVKLFAEKVGLEGDLPEDDEDLDELLDGAMEKKTGTVEEKDKLINKLTKDQKKLTTRLEAMENSNKELQQKELYAKRDNALIEVLENPKIPVKPAFKKFVLSELTANAAYSEEDDSWLFNGNSATEAVESYRKEHGDYFGGDPVGGGGSSPPQGSGGEVRFSDGIKGLN